MRRKRAGILLIVIQVHDDVRDQPNQRRDEFLVNREQVEKAIEHQQLDAREEGNRDAPAVELTTRDRECTQRVGVAIGQSILDEEALEVLVDRRDVGVVVAAGRKALARWRAFTQQIGVAADGLAKLRC